MNTGIHQGLMVRLKNWAKEAGNDKVFLQHCMPHKLELTLTHGLKRRADFQLIEDTAQDLYTYFNKHKISIVLKNVALMFQNDFITLKEIIEIRWAASDYRAYAAIDRIEWHFRWQQHSPLLRNLTGPTTIMSTSLKPTNQKLCD